MEEGVNLIGYARGEFGIGESCRNAAKAMEAVSLSFGILNFPLCGQRQEDITMRHIEMEKPKYNINIFHMSPDQMWHALEYFKYDDLLNDRYNIGYWAWELPDFPEEWMDAERLVDEVWVPSTFSHKALSKKLSVPVVRMPHAIDVRLPDWQIDRTYFGLPRNQFLFLAMYDVFSVQERKNPNAVIKAFQRAFPRKNKRAGLILKVNSSEHGTSEVKKLKQMTRRFPNIYVIDSVLSREEVNGLLNSVDCLVSLHRSEGFGLSLAEAMFLGTPVIATNWSGNIDFMNENNSCPVDYSLIEIERDYGHYRKGQIWADANIDHAAYYMRKLVSDKNWAYQMASNGHDTIRNELSPELIGALYIKRFKEIGLIK